MLPIGLVMPLQPRTILLASASPRRRELLEALGHRVIVRAVEIDERNAPGEAPDAYLDRIVHAKLAAARALTLFRPFDAMLVADTTVVVDGVILQKPETPADAKRMLTLLSGRAHTVTTRFAVAATTGVTHVESVSTKVFFRPISPVEIDAYVATQEGRDKAGAYAIQGKGAAFIPRIEGSFGAVVGLPTCEVTVALHRLFDRK